MRYYIGEIRNTHNQWTERILIGVYDDSIVEEDVLSNPAVVEYIEDWCANNFNSYDFDSDFYMEGDAEEAFFFFDNTEMILTPIEKVHAIAELATWDEPIIIEK